jgi:magnesium-transporting ATPase (P-type)
MDHRLIAPLLFVSSLVAILIGYVLYEHPAVLGLCAPDTPNYACLSQDVFYGIAHPLYFNIRLLPFLFLALMFVRNEVFYSWLRFFAVISIIAIILIVSAPPVAHDFLPVLPDRSQMTELMVRFVVLASAVFIAAKYALLRRRRAQVE